VENRGRYYDQAGGVLRDMIQNHMFQMMAYLCMEPPTSFRPEAIRNEKAKLLESVRLLGADDVRRDTVRGQYGRGQMPDGQPVVGYRQEPDVDPASPTETFAAMKLVINNWRWQGVPVYLRSGKRLWKRGTEIVVQFKQAPDVVFRDTPVGELDSNRLLFHIQPDQGIELRFHAKIPGPAMQLQKVNMRFSYGDAFKTGRGTGYEVLLYNCMVGDSTLFSRSDMIESAWRIAQPVLDAWAAEPPADFPSYQAGSWGPRAAYDLIERDGRKWVEVVNRDVLEQIPLFAGCDAVFLNALAMILEPVVFEPGNLILRQGESGSEMYVICRGEVEVLNAAGEILGTLGPGNFFGEIGLLLAQPRMATIRAKTLCDLFVLERGEFSRALRDHPRVAGSIYDVARNRYQLSARAEDLFDPEVASFVGRV
jgi:glucose-6-phosphate 1-dehydrogenase